MIFKIIAVITFLAFYGCYFIKMLSQKKQGIKTDQLGNGKVGFVKFVEVALKMGAIFVFIAGVVSVFAVENHTYITLRVIGAIFSIMGTVIFIIAVNTMRDSWRAGVSETDKTELVTDGIYKISRNPAFLGFDLLYIGTLLMFFNVPLCIFTVFAVTMYHLQIVNVEEDFLIVTFGKEYLQYKKKVCRYIGRK